MAKFCKCGNVIPKHQKIDGRRRNLSNRTQCLICLPFNSSKYRLKTPEEIRSQNAEKSRRHYHKRKSITGIDPVKQLRKSHKLAIIKALGSRCQLCGYDKCIRNLAFHHISNKAMDLSERGFQRSLDIVLAEIRKCILVCHNCHGEIHEGLADESVITLAHSRLLAALVNFQIS